MALIFIHVYLLALNFYSSISRYLFVIFCLLLSCFNSNPLDLVSCQNDFWHLPLGSLWQFRSWNFRCSPCPYEHGIPSISTLSSRHQNVYIQKQQFAWDISYWAFSLQSSKWVGFSFVNTTIILVEWEWIPLERNIGIYLRNKANKLYLCFDKYGKPIGRVTFLIDYCFSLFIILNENNV